MREIELCTEVVQAGLGHTSKGNQLKWRQGNFWYKADAFGFESLSETITSTLLSFANIACVPYMPVAITYRGRRYRGCRSLDFCGEGEELITLERLSRAYTGRGLSDRLAGIYEVKEKISYTVDFVRRVTGLTEFGTYLTGLLEIDGFFLNEDRHTNNIAVLYNRMTKTYRLCPVFDMGLSLFSDTRVAYPLELDFESCRSQIEAKPFSRDFDEQLDSAEELFGNSLRFSFCSEEIVERACLERFVGAYSKEELQRAEDVLRNQARKYRYLFRR